MRKTFRILPPLLTLLILLAACAPAASEPAGAQSQRERLRVVASISPVTNIVYNIGGDRIDLDGILPPGVDPHTFEPRPSDAVKLAQADLIFVNGMGLDESTMKLAQANLQEGSEIIQLAAAVAEPDELIYGLEHHHGHGEEEGHDDDEEGHAEEEGHDDDDEEGHAEEDDREDDDEHDDGEKGAPDPHLLLDPNFVIRYAKVVCVNLAAHDPDNDEFYRANLDEFTARLLALDEAIRATTATIPAENRRLLAYHDSFGYFGRRYGYTIVGAIQPADAFEPSAQEVAALIEQLRAEGVPAIFGSALFYADVLEQISRETGAAVSSLLDEDLPGVPGDPEHTYIGMMVENMRTLARSLGGDPSLMDGVEVGNVNTSDQ
jgi:ABC-type Zn uptake system ZnuABC Zn-binding protein ZnuA